MLMATRATHALTACVIYAIISAIIHPVRGQCSGSTLVLTASGTYQTFTSPNYPFSYSNDLNCLWRIEAANATDAIRLEVTDASTEYHADCVYDYGEVYDGYNSTSSSLGKFCGTSTPSYVSTGNYMAVAFISDYSLSARGFKAQYKSGERSSLLDPEDDSSSFDAVAILGASIGAVVLIVVVMAIIFTYIQAKKAKEIRRNPHLRRGASTSRVEPFSYDYGPTEYWGPPPPPPYGDIYSSPVSPPPAYAEVDPNPQQELQLPGRPIDDSNGTSTTMGPGCHVNVICDSGNNRTDTNANTRFIRSPHPPLDNRHRPIANLVRNPVYLPSNQGNQSQTGPNVRNPSVIANGSSSSNAGATAAMRLLGGTPRDVGLNTVGQEITAQPNDQATNLPNAISSPTSNTADPLLNVAQTGTATSLGQENMSRPANNGLPSVGSASRQSNTVAPPRNINHSRPSNTSVPLRNQNATGSTNNLVPNRTVNQTQSSNTSVPMRNPDVLRSGNAPAAVRNNEAPGSSGNLVSPGNPNVSQSVNSSAPIRNGSQHTNVAPRIPNVSRPSNRITVPRNTSAAVGTASNTSQNLRPPMPDRNIQRAEHNVIGNGVQRTSSGVSDLALPEDQPNSASPRGSLAPVSSS